MYYQERHMYIARFTDIQIAGDNAQIQDECRVFLASQVTLRDPQTQPSAIRNSSYLQSFSAHKTHSCIHTQSNNAK
jgi:hypothetical protein